MFVYLWEYFVSPQHQADFEREYGPDGSWASLFTQSPSYFGTTLLRDVSNDERFLTVDRWESEGAHAEFVDSVRTEYAELDARCEALTKAETLVGRFHFPGRAF